MANPEGIGGAKPGEVRNPTGDNGHNAGWQRYGDRLQKWLALPVPDLIKIVEGVPAPAEEQIEGKPPKYLEKPTLKSYSVIDTVCIMHAYEMIKGDKKTLEREHGLNRIEGRPTQKVDLVQAPFHVTINK